MGKLRVLDLFSGIGGFSLGLERTGGFETVAFCEIEEFPRKVLAKHWPDVPIYKDVRNVTGTRLAADGISVDVITGGFPCQDISISGRKEGIKDGTRSGLWSEIIRLACEIRPQYIIVENVANLLSGPSERRGAWFGRVLGDLAEVGYDAEWHCIPASHLGAYQHRDRVWIISNPHKVGWRLYRDVFDSITNQVRVPRPSSEALGAPSSEWFLAQGNMPDLRKSNGISDAAHRLRAIGNSVVPQIPEMIGYAILEAEHG